MLLCLQNMYFLEDYPNIDIIPCSNLLSKPMPICTICESAEMIGVNLLEDYLSKHAIKLQIIWNGRHSQNTDQLPKIFRSLHSIRSKMSSPVRNDVIGQVNGNFGRWQLRTIILIFLCKIPSSWFMACVIYTAPAPKKSDYYCNPFNDSVVTNSQDWVKKSQPSYIQRATDREFQVDFCQIYEQTLDSDFIRRHSNYSNPFLQPRGPDENIIPCSHFEHNPVYSSLVTDFDLICSRQLLVSVSQAGHALGTLIGGLIATKLLKRISPRRLMLIGMLSQIFFGNLTGLVHSFNLHMFYRCVTAACCAFMYTAGQMILADITAGKAKVIITTLFELFWSIGLILLPGISIFVDSWTHLYVAISSPTILLVFLHRWITDSPRWLLKQGKIENTMNILLESAAFNNKQIPLDLEQQLQEMANNIRNVNPPSYWSIWDGKTNRSFIIAVHMAWVWAVMLYNAMIINIRSFGVDHIHSNTVILGFAEMIGVFGGLYFILYTRRRWLWVGYCITIAGFLTFFIWTVPSTMKESKQAGLEIIFCTGLKIANALSMSILITCTGELVTEEKRPILMFSVVTWSRIWLLIAPFIIALSTIHKLIPVTIFAGLAVINGLFMCYINEQFWNFSHPKIERVPTLTTFRRNSAILLMKRNSTCSELNIGMSTPPRASISDLLSTCEAIEEKF
ncbi:solute carrier family 22 member 7-like [Hermetia illucens]|uniref:solute carrier family 22 member 7-like n=1 Tax=Hermetia illucens TaxID=343691 RepID=UPI0018CC10ED|nr:solute carrier family 22 member 7-like [Hermetia illucens]